MENNTFAHAIKFIILISKSSYLSASYWIHVGNMWDQIVEIGGVDDNQW